MRKEISWSFPFRATRAACRYSVLTRDRVTAQKPHDSILPWVIWRRYRLTIYVIGLLKIAKFMVVLNYT